MWGKKKNKEKQSGKSASDKAAFAVGKMIKNMENRFGKTLNRKTANLSQKGKIILLIAVLLFFGGGSIYIIVDGINSSKPSSELRQNSISIPKHINRAGDENTRIKDFVTEEDVKKIKQFRRYMDSLKTSKEGLRTYDSIVKARPRLLDSVAEVEQLYGIDTTKGHE